MRVRLSFILSKYDMDEQGMDIVYYVRSFLARMPTRFTREGAESFAGNVEHAIDQLEHAMNKARTSVREETWRVSAE